MAMTLSCFTNSYGASGVWTAVEQIGETGIHHLELALRGHNFGGLVIPESAVITERTDDQTARSFVAHLDRFKVQISGCNVGGADIRTIEGVELTERRIRFAARWFGVSICVSGAGQPETAAERRTIVAHLRRLGESAAAEGVTLALETHKGPTQNAAAMLALMTDVDHPGVRLNFDTGNIAYYNQGFDPCDELDKVKYLVKNVHLKDNRGGFEDWYFPRAGRRRECQLREGAANPRERAIRRRLHHRDRRHRRRARARAGTAASANRQERPASQGLRVCPPVDSPGLCRKRSSWPFQGRTISRFDSPRRSGQMSGRAARQLANTISLGEEPPSKVVEDWGLAVSGLADLPASGRPLNPQASLWAPRRLGIHPGWISTQKNRIGLVGPMSNYASPPQLVEGVPYRDWKRCTGSPGGGGTSIAGSGSRPGSSRGSAMLVKRAVYETVGGLDERFGLGLFDDDDLAVRARRAGFELAVAHDLFIHHFGSRTFAGNGIDAERLLAGERPQVRGEVGDRGATVRLCR